MKKVMRIGAVTTLVLIAVLLAIYILLGLYYMGGFPCFTWINGVYATGKSVSAVNSELIRNDNYDGVAILDKSGARLFVSSQDVDMTIDYTDSLNGIFYGRNPLLWGVYVFESMTREYKPIISINSQKLSDILSDWEIFVNPDDFECSIERTAEGYELKNAYITVPSLEKVDALIYSAMMNQESVVDLSGHDECYREVDLRSSERRKIALFSRIDIIQNVNINYEVGEGVVTLDRNKAASFIITEDEIESALSETVNPKVPGQGLFIIGDREENELDPEKISSLQGIAMDADGFPIVSEKKMYAFFENIADTYDTAWMMDRYRQGLINTVIINDNSKGDGSIYDIDAEFSYLRDVYTGAEKPVSVRTFTLSETAVSYNAHEHIGSTYIEIDMGNQVLHYYVDGEINMEFPIVTGNIGRSRGTPTGIYPIYNKRYHTYLRGADYVSYVNYWLGVNKGIGIHDATWRNKFGEEIYKTDGSHGCINTPLEKMETLYNIVEVGTPAVLYY